MSLKHKGLLFCLLPLLMAAIPLEVHGVARPPLRWRDLTSDGITLSNWKYHPGDNIAWADPAFDDRSWEPASAWLQPHQLPADGWPGIGWFRAPLAIDSSLWNIPLALNMFQHGAAEIYLDGQKIYAFGTVGTSAQTEEAYHERNPKVISFSEKTDHLIAVRYSNFQADMFHSCNWPAGFSITLADLNESVKRRIATLEEAEFYHVALTGVPLIFTFLHFLLFLFYPRSRENLHYAVFTLCFAALAFFEGQIKLFTSIPEQTLFFSRLFRAGTFITFIAAMRFQYALFYPTLPRHFWAFFAAGMGLGVWDWFKPIDAWSLFFSVFALVACGEMLRVCLMAIAHRQYGAWILGTGFVILNLAIIHLGMILLGFATPLVGVPIYYIGELGVLFSMSVYLAHNFARTSRDLEKRLVQVRELSEKTLEQERRAREKEIQRRLLEADNARKTQELQEARKLQLSMLPEAYPDLPDLEIAWSTEPATEVGGDYYDYHIEEDGTLTVALGDATGHGLAPGIIVTATKGLFQVLSFRPDILQIFATISRILKDMNLRHMNMAMIVVKIKGDRIKVSGAGMPPMLIYRAAAQKVEEVELIGLPLGSSRTPQYEQREFELQPGDTILLMTDGLPERLNNEEEMLGYSRTHELLAEVGQKSPREICDYLSQQSEIWAKGRPRDDDMSFIAIKSRA